MHGTQFHKPIVVGGSINADLVFQTERIPLSRETLLGVQPSTATRAEVDALLSQQT
jgi:hypothetical protein